MLVFSGLSAIVQETLIYINEYRSPKELRTAIRGYIDDYNSLRPHEALDYSTPDEVYKTCFSVNGAA